MTISAAPPSRTEPRLSVRVRLAMVLVVALALRLAAAFLVPVSETQKAQASEQRNVAAALVAGRGFGSPFFSNQVSAIMPPVYPLVVAGFFRAFGVRTDGAMAAVHVFDCLISTLAVIPIFLVARRSFGDRTAWWAVWVWTYFPYAILYAAQWPWSTHLALLCVCWMVYLSQKLEDAPSPWLWAGFGLLAGFAGLTEPITLVAAAFLLAFACGRLAKTGRRWLLPAAAASLALAATLSPWMIRNAVVFHRFIPMRDSMGLELWMGNNGYTERYTSDQLNPLHNGRELADYNRMGELAYMDLKKQQAVAYIGSHPGWYAWMCLRRAVYLWTGFWSLGHGFLAAEPGDLGKIFIVTSMTLLAIAGLVLAWRRKRSEAIRVGGVLFVVPILYYFTHPEPYHMRMLDPLILMLACLVFTAEPRAKAAGSAPELQQ